MNSYAPSEELEMVLAPCQSTGTTKSISRRDNEAYALLQAEISNISSIGCVSVDWDRIYNIAKDILCHDVKDLVVVGYMILAMTHREGVKGLQTGVTLLSGFLLRYWQDMQPGVNKIYLRIRALDWLDKKLVRYLQSENKVGDDFQHWSQLKHELDYLGIAVLEISGDLAGILTETRTILNSLSGAPRRIEIEDSMRTTATTTDVKQTINKDSGDNDKTQLLVEIAIQDGDSLDANIRQHQKSLRTMAAYHMKRCIHSPVYYHLSRVANWLPIRSLPINENHITLLDSPGLSVTQKILSLKNENSAEVVNYLESVLAGNPFWFDGQYQLCMIMQSLGDEYSTARNVIRAETKSLLARFPELISMKFSNGTPFFSDDTKDWLSEAVPIISHEIICAENVENNAVSEILQLINEPGSNRENLLRIQHQILSVNNGRLRFQLCISLVDYCILRKKYDEAILLLDSLECTARERDLMHWEPDLYRDFTDMLGVIYRRISANEPHEVVGFRVRIDEIWRRHSTFDPIMLIMRSDAGASRNSV